MSAFTFVTPRLATGAAIRTPTDAQHLLAAGVTHILNCANNADDGPLFSKSPVVCFCNATDDDGQPKPSEWFARSLAFALPVLAQPRLKLYAHCEGGRNRGPVTAYAILRALGWTAASAERLIREARPEVASDGWAGLAYTRDADSAIDILGYA